MSRIWVICKVPPVVRDTAYLVGRLATRFGSTIVTTVESSAQTVPPPPSGVDIIWNRTLSISQNFLQDLDRLAEEMGVPVVNQGAPTMISNDKRNYASIYSGLVPPTWVAAEYDELVSIWESQRRPLVIKHPFGKFGREVELYSGHQDKGKSDRLLEIYPNSGLVVQQFCKDFSLGDKRIILHRAASGGYDVVAWYKKVPPPGGWISNLSFGGRLEMCELEQDEIDLSLQVAELSNLDFVGLDVGRQDGKPLLIETNAYTGGHIDFDMAFEDATSGDAFARMMRAISGRSRGSSGLVADSDA